MGPGQVRPPTTGRASWRITMGSVVALLVLMIVGVGAGSLALKARAASSYEARRLRSSLATVSIASFAIAALLGIYRCVVVIPPGNVGVAVLFGKVAEHPFSEGLH